eukprot:m.205022 g.205022  ORF g.205022 m.205022 type:complete len:495 (+) comp22751_c0_seq1:95-1579(+)
MATTLWLQGGFTLLAGILFSFWLTHVSPWARGGLAAENAYLREELSRLQAMSCREEAERHAQVATVMLRDQLEQRNHMVDELRAQLANCTNVTLHKDTDCSSSTPFQAVPPYQPHRMREVLDWESFDRGFVYSWRRYWRVNSHQGNLRKELQEAITASKQYLTTKDFAWQHGQFQLDTRRGITYLMDFEKRNQGSKIYHRIRMFRPISSTVYPYPFEVGGDQQNRTLHMVVALKGRSAACQSFLNRIKNVAHSPGDQPFRLTVVYFVEGTDGEGGNGEDGKEALTEVHNALEASKRDFGLQYTLITKHEPFSRGKGLQYGATESQPSTPRAAGEPEEILSFMDVDMIFTREYLYRCRANAEQGASVYFPIPFSLFKHKNETVAHENGDWRTYGLGMVCISVSDFVGSHGYNTQITGWGREDVDFYERMLKNASLQVMRAIDEGLMHRWHPKVCDNSELSTDQYQDCIQSQADWEGDKLYLSRQLSKYRDKYGEL